MSRPAALALATVLSTTIVAGCLGTEPGTGAGGDCVSSYAPLARAATWPDLRRELVGSGEPRRVASVRVQERGTDVGVGDQEAVRVVDLLDRRGRRIHQADVWRTASGGWAAGVWQQCTD